MWFANLGHGRHEVAENLGMGWHLLFLHKDIAANLIGHDLQNVKVLGNELWRTALGTLR